MIAVESFSSVQFFCNPVNSSPPGSSIHGIFPGKNTGVGCHFLLQVIFPTQGSNPGLLHCRWILCHLSHQGSPSSHYPSPQCHTWVSHHRGPRWVYAVATQTWQALRLERVSFREWVLYLHMCLLNRGKIEIFSILNKQK